jgi:hypothetical protein
VPDGCEFASAEELFNAKIYGGRSIRERWHDIRIFQIGGISIDDWVADDYVCKEPAWRWALVGNIVDQHSYGEEHETRRGTKQFAPGAKVYLAPGQWGDGYEKVFVIGKPRHQRGLIKIIMPQRYIENFRLQKVFDPKVLELMREDRKGYGYCWWGNTDADRDEILRYLDWFNPAEAQKQREKWDNPSG